MAPFAALQSRSDRAFERLYRRHVDDVYRYALAVLANRADAEDVTQTAFLNAYRAFQSGRHPERPLNWLIAITHNVCRQRFRESKRRPKEVVLDHEVAGRAGEEEEEGFRREDIVRALSQLNFNQRAALVMRELEGRSYGEIAEILDLSVAAVETLIFRARRAFREQLEGTLTCGDAERALSRDLDRMLPRSERAELRAHLRSCDECATLARRFRAQRTALRGIGIVPLPTSLAGFSATGGGSGLLGGAVLGGGVGIKVAALGAAALVVAGVSSETGRPTKDTPAAARVAPPSIHLPWASAAVETTIVRSAPSGKERRLAPPTLRPSPDARTTSLGGSPVHTAVRPQAPASEAAVTARPEWTRPAGPSEVKEGAKPKPTSGAAHPNRPTGKPAAPGKRDKSRAAANRGQARGPHGASTGDKGGEKSSGNNGNADDKGPAPSRANGQAKPEKENGNATHPSPPQPSPGPPGDAGAPADAATNGSVGAGAGGGASSKSKDDSKAKK